MMLPLLEEHEPDDTDEVEDLVERLGDAIRERRAKGVTTIVIDHAQFKRFKNIIHFATDPEGLGVSSLWEYTRQYQYLRDFYSLTCPQCNMIGPNPLMPYDTWGKDPQQLQDEVLFEQSEAGVYACGKCGLLQKDANLPNYSEMIGCCGMRSGKTMLAAMILLWEIHSDLMLDDPQRTWGIMPGQEVYYTCATTKAEQAKDTIFAAIDGIFENSQWFTRYNQALKQYAEDLDVPFDKIFVKNLSEIRYLHKQLFIDNTGTNSAGIAGKTRKIVVIDEIARFVQTDSRLGVDLVYDTLKASLLTLAIYRSKMICISSPMIKTDKIMRLLDDAKKEKNPTTLRFHHPTWDFNPKLPKDHPWIVEQFEKNPRSAKRDFGADPPGAENPWLEDEWRIDEAVDPNIAALFRTRTKTNALIVKGVRTDTIGKEITFKDIVTTKHIVIACDPGYRKDSFGMIAAYLKPIRTARGIEEHMFVGAAEAWEPSKNPRLEVDFRNVITTIKELAKWWIVDKVTYDQWSSPPQIQELMSKGIDAERISLKKEDWEALATLFYNRQIHLLHPKIGGAGAEKLIWELKNLELKDSGQIDHATFSSSDLAVCLARATKTLLGPEETQRRVSQNMGMGFGKTVPFRRP